MPATGLMVFTPQDLQTLLQVQPKAFSKNHPIFLSHVYTGKYSDRPVAVAGPMLGAPQAVLVLEKLIALGVRSVVAMGWCGSLQSRVAIGDLVIPLRAVSEEGTSRHYPVEARQARPAAQIVARLEAVLGADADCTLHQGGVWSTDAPYRETVAKVRRYREEGLLGVEMETSALFTVAAYRGIDLAAVLIVSDDLSGSKWRHGFRDGRFLAARKRVPELILKALCSEP